MQNEHTIVASAIIVCSFIFLVNMEKLFHAAQKKEPEKSNSKRKTILENKEMLFLSFQDFQDLTR